MITFLIVAGSILGYLAIGAVYARLRVVALHAKARKEYKHDTIVRETLTAMLVWRVLFWPWGMVFDFFAGGLSSWLMAPVDERKARAAQLRKDADAWLEKAGSRAATADERQMARELAILLREQAKEVDL